jgi:CubicO group peptidase (beta-lactamase class C family)
MFRAIYRKFGAMEIEKDKHMQFDTIFQIASMTKSIVTVAVMMLYEEGRFQLGDPASQFIPGLKQLKVAASFENAIPQLAELEREITVFDLLTHTSGISSAFENTPIGEAYSKAEWGHPDDTFDDMIKKLIAIPLLHQPGAAWTYGNSTDVLGAGVGFGLSFWVVNDAAQTRLLQSEGAYGWAGGASTYFWIDPKEERLGILMAQFIPFTQYPVARQFRVLAYQAIID